MSLEWRTGMQLDDSELEALYQRTCVTGITGKNDAVRLLLAKSGDLAKEGSPAWYGWHSSILPTLKRICVAFWRGR